MITDNSNGFGAGSATAESMSDLRLRAARKRLLESAGTRRRNRRPARDCGELAWFRRDGPVPDLIAEPIVSGFFGRSESILEQYDLLRALGDLGCSA